VVADHFCIFAFHRLGKKFMSFTVESLRDDVKHLIGFQNSDGAFVCKPEFSLPIMDLESLFLAGKPDQACLIAMNKIGLTYENTSVDSHRSAYLHALAPESSISVEQIVSDAVFFNDPFLMQIAECRGAKTIELPDLVLDIWDTAYAIQALIRANESFHYEKAASWLLSRQCSNGGWACSSSYPLEDADSTSVVVLALIALPHGRIRFADSIAKALVWLESLYCLDGSYKTFDQQHGIPCPEVTSAVAVVKQAAGKIVCNRTINYLIRTRSNAPFWYQTNSRHASSLRTLGITLPVQSIRFQEELAFAHSPQRRRHLVETAQMACTRFMGNIRIFDDCWSHSTKLIGAFCIDSKCTRLVA
jgi:Squalene-hopene cyclase C-terminal domain